MSNKTPRLENWHIHYVTKKEQVVYGKIYDDERFPDGVPVRTSRIVSMDGDMVTTKNTTYKLGKPLEV